MKRFSDDSGAVAVIVAICIVVLMTIAAFAVDLGMWYTAKRQMQSAADAAALAGCRVLADDGDDSAVWAAVTDYAGRNFVSAPVDPAASSVIPPSAGGLSDIGADFVKVTVRTDSPSFFARLMGFDNGLVRAQSVAKIGYLLGGRAPVPWGLSVLHVTEGEAVMGGETVSLWDEGDGWWGSAFSAGHPGPVSVFLENSLAYVERFDNVVTVGSLPAGGLMTAIDLDRTTFTGGGTAHLEVTLAPTVPADPAPKVTARSGGGALVTLVKDSATGHWVGSVGIASTTEEFIRVPIEVTCESGTGRDAVKQTSVCSVMSRRANCILRDVEVDPAFAAPGDPVTLRVQTLDFDYGVPYELKVEGGDGTTGNFLALAFGSLLHSDCGYPTTPDPGGTGGSEYSDYIVGDPNLVVHINDWVDTEPGVMVGPTRQGINDRLAGVTMVSLAAWEAAGRPDTKQILIIPICEKPDAVTGRAALKIISFATFFMETKPDSHGIVTGRFVEYTAPGWFVGDTPPDPLAIKAVHLVSDHLDF